MTSVTLWPGGEPAGPWTEWQFSELACMAAGILLEREEARREFDRVRDEADGVVVVGPPERPGEGDGSGAVKGPGS